MLLHGSRKCAGSGRFFPHRRASFFREVLEKRLLFPAGRNGCAFCCVCPGRTSGLLPHAVGNGLSYHLRGPFPGNGYPDEPLSGMLLCDCSRPLAVSYCGVAGRHIPRTGLSRLPDRRGAGCPMASSFSAGCPSLVLFEAFLPSCVYDWDSGFPCSGDFIPADDACDRG